MNELFVKCTFDDPDKRPTISELIDDFYNNIFIKKTNHIPETDTISSIENIHDINYSRYWFYVAENNDPLAQKKISKII